MARRILPLVSSRRRARALLVVGVAGLAACATPTPDDATRNPCADRVSLVHQGEGGLRELLVRNRCHVPLALVVALPEARNVVAAPPPPVHLLLPPGDERTALRVRQADPERPWHYRVRFRFVPGPDPPVHRDEVRYAWPFGGGQPCRLVQGIGGSPTHRGPHRYAFDFEMPAGTPILAARDGIVFQVIDGFPAGALEEAYRNRGNAVRILHDDGTLAEYGHLRRGVVVREGARVGAGALLGYSGSSGYASGPHLHFHVAGREDGEPLTVPIRFEGDVVPREGGRYGPARAATR